MGRHTIAWPAKRTQYHTRLTRGIDVPGACVVVALLLTGAGDISSRLSVVSSNGRAWVAAVLEKYRTCQSQGWANSTRAVRGTFPLSANTRLRKCRLIEHFA
jgi:hypothetical protein